MPFYKNANPVHRYLVDQQVLPTCLNCSQFNKETNLCLLAGVQPPPEVLVFGCERWDNIPF